MKRKPSDLSKILSYIALRPRSEKEVRERLTRYGSQEKEQIIANLKQNDLINDFRFAKWLVNSRVSSKPKSLWQLTAELKRYGIAEEYICQLLNTEVESEALTNLIRKKLRSLTPEKLIQYLMRQGFSYSKIQAKLDEIGISG